METKCFVKRSLVVAAINPRAAKSLRIAAQNYLEARRCRLCGRGRARAQQSLKHLFVTMPFHFKNGSGEEGGLLARSPDNESREEAAGMEEATGIEAAAGMEAINTKDAFLIHLQMLQYRHLD